MKDSTDDVIYVGKARDLKKRVSSYFQKNHPDPKTAALVQHIADVDYIITKNEKEALILENNLIKEHMPRYNIDLKDSKRYAYVMLREEPFPRLLLARDRKEKGTYFGPFTSSEKRDIILRFAINTFRLRTCKLRSRRPCLRYQMGLCSGACSGAVTEQEYRQQVEDTKAFLSGRSEQLVRDLEKRMKDFSSRQDYEQARQLRDQIAAIRSQHERQLVEKDKDFDQDVINYIKDSDVHIAVFKIYKGALSGKEEYDFPEKEEFFEEFLMLYYGEHAVPKEIILPEMPSPELQEFISDIRGTKVIFTMPERGEKKELLDLARINLESSYQEGELMVRDLKERLGLDEDPKIIECFDVSHLSGTDSVASMVRFDSGTPDKSNYRRFRIRLTEGIDDFAMIREAVRRRYARLRMEGKQFPHLVVIDGGAGQLSSALEAMAEVGVRIPVIGLAKRNEEIFFPGMDQPILLEKKTRALQLLQRIRDEAHRFAVKYHRLLRSKRYRK